MSLRSRVVGSSGMTPPFPAAAPRNRALQDRLDCSGLGGRSSVGRAPGCGPGGRGFESPRSPLGSPEFAGLSSFRGPLRASNVTWRVQGRLVEKRLGPKGTAGGDGLTKAQAEKELRKHIDAGTMLPTSPRPGTAGWTFTR